LVAAGFALRTLHVAFALSFVVMIDVIIVYIAAELVLLASGIAGGAGMLITVSARVLVLVYREMTMAFTLVMVALCVVLALILSKVFAVCVPFFSGHALLSFSFTRLHRVRPGLSF
jgi:hypothetical protein